MKLVFNIILLTAIAFQSLHKLCALAGFALNQPYIAATLCENRDRPEKKCNGKCQLAKTLDRDQKRENIPGNSTKEKFELIWFVSGSKPTLPSERHLERLQFEFQFISKIPPIASPVFHPPNT